MQETRSWEHAARAEALTADLRFDRATQPQFLHFENQDNLFTFSVTFSESLKGFSVFLPIRDFEQSEPLFSDSSVHFIHMGPGQPKATIQDSQPWFGYNSWSSLPQICL